ncbi:4-demethylwyosine synthase TYW1 [archaeon]|jgi:tRNA wybutosine-synthesizing protein 1|nr:4-demethylwyosine synthase TYW1 [archaeon]
MSEELQKKKLEKQGYRFVGKHSAVKICTYTKNAVIGKGTCYKEKFYGLKSHQCVQMTTSMTCPNRCQFCWRSLDSGTDITMKSGIDDPKQIIDSCFEEQRLLMSGFGGHPTMDKEKLEEAKNPKYFAISLTGEPTMYPKMNEFLKELRKRKCTSFLVTNGMFPEALEKLTDLPSQLYLSLDAPTKELYMEVDNPVLKDYWERMERTLKLFSTLNTRKVIRITAVKNLNMCEEDAYVKLIKEADPDFLEVKGYSWIGSSRERLVESNVPTHQEARDFAQTLAEKLGWEISNEHKASRAILVTKKGFKITPLEF